MLSSEKGPSKQEVTPIEELKAQKPAPIVATPVSELSTVLTRVESGLSSWQRTVYRVEKHIATLKRAEDKETKERPDAGQLINASIYMQWFLAKSPLYLSFLATIKPLRNRFIKQNTKICLLSQDLRGVVDEFFTCEDRVAMGRVCQDFKFFSDQNRKRYGIPPNYTAEPEILKSSQDEKYTFFHIGKDRILRGVNFAGRNGFDMQVMRDGRIAELSANNKITIYDNPELEKKSSETLLFPDPEDKMGGVISSIDVLLDGRYVVGKFDGVIEIYNKDLKLEPMPIAVAEKLKTCVSCVTRVTVLSNGMIISNHARTEKEKLNGEVRVPFHLATDPKTGKATEFLNEFLASNVVELPYQHFAVITDTVDFNYQITIMSANTFRVKRQVVIDLDSEDALPFDVRHHQRNYPRLCAGDGKIFAYFEGALSVLQFPLCAAENNPLTIAIEPPKMRLGSSWST